MVLVATFALRVHEHLGDTLEWIQTHRLIGVFAFTGLYFVFAALPLPASVLGLSAGVMFGLWYGALLIYFGSLLGAAGGFLLGRWLLRDWVASVAYKSPTWRAIERAVAEEGWKVVLMLRLSPAFPFTAVNYAAGLTCISFREFMGASAVGLIPVSLAYAYAGSLAVDLKEVVSGHTRLSPFTLLLFGGVSAAFFGAAVALLTMYTRRQLRRQLQEDEDDRSVNEEQRAEAGQGQGQLDPLL
ncbi:g2097 [Coccomyxa elongata]